MRCLSTLVATLTPRRLQGAGEFSMLAGALSKLLTSNSMAQKKVDNFMRYACLFPEYNFIFMGDSGQVSAQLGWL